jgi:hypothetical protein
VGGGEACEEAHEMTDSDARMIRTLIAKYGIYGIALELCRVLKMYPLPKWRPVQHRAVQLLYVSGLAVGKSRLLQ